MIILRFSAALLLMIVLCAPLDVRAQESQSRPLTRSQFQQKERERTNLLNKWLDRLFPPKPAARNLEPHVIRPEREIKRVINEKGDGATEEIAEFNARELLRARKSQIDAWCRRIGGYMKWDKVPTTISLPQSKINLPTVFDEQGNILGYEERDRYYISIQLRGYCIISAIIQT